MIDKKIIKLVTYLFLSLFFSSVIVGQALTLDATTSKQALPMGGTFTYTVTISGADIKNVPDPQLPDLNGHFQFYQHLNLAHFLGLTGLYQAQKTKRYQLMPLVEGALTIGETILEFNGNEFQNKPNNHYGVTSISK